ncbi:hypothetical protein LptCag_1925 [Leptospirillum ferriphilum]|uniref:Uncharacterized protein n=1 Tax=Leptospirillum ferriphilum TaxID=178606 RepID=A0A094WDA9_9BACT|nr:hypothetical protein LptCag_1925 [Leptospirillum ferriphilum]
MVFILFSKIHHSLLEVFGCSKIKKKIFLSKKGQESTTMSLLLVRKCQIFMVQSEPCS